MDVSRVSRETAYHRRPASGHGCLEQTHHYHTTDNQYDKGGWFYRGVQPTGMDSGRLGKGAWVSKREGATGRPIFSY
jgi:hypothetical protein